MAVQHSSETNQYLTYKLGNELFALDIAKVREVLDFTAITQVPKMPEFMRGVINLRGSAVPVVDLRLKLGMPKTDKTVDTCVIITEVRMNGDATTVGALADSVQEVMDLDPEHIESAPRIGTGLNTDFIKGMGRHGERFIIILDIDKVFSAGELAAIPAAASEPALAAA